ncbi:hypothetical protein Dimus_033211 [Dionaea muscipula]
MEVSSTGNSDGEREGMARALIESALVEIEVQEDVTRRMPEGCPGIAEFVGKGRSVGDDWCGKVGHRVVQCRAPFDPIRKVWQMRDKEVPAAGPAKQLQIVEGMTSGLDAAFVQQRAENHEEVSDPLRGWNSISKKGVSRPTVYSPTHISLHKRFEGLELEENMGESE